MEKVKVTIDSAIPCGLIMNELISNIYKHAFPDDHSGEIHVSLKKTEDEEIEFIVSDNGIGIPDKLDIRKVESLGLQSVVALAEHQLFGSVNLVKDNGTQFQIRFKELPGKERV
jgi:two-component sensor histidine kinase